MKIDRLIGILTILMQKEKTTAPYLARKFEVSRRTILRDVEALCTAGIPIVTKQGGDGGISVMEGYRLDKSILTAEELQSIIVGLKGLDSVSGVSNMERLLLKLAPSNDSMISLADRIIIDLSSYYKNSLSEKISLVKQAINNSALIEFDYYYSKGQTRRKIEPYCIIFKWSSWYVFGYCSDRQDFRAFKLNRLWCLRVTDESFKPRTIPEGRVESFGSFNDENNILVLFDRSVRYRLIEDYGLYCYTETDDGLQLSLDYANKDYILSWLLSFGDKAEIISPDDIRAEMKELILRAAKRYADE